MYRAGLGEVTKFKRILRLTALEWTPLLDWEFWVREEIANGGEKPHSVDLLERESYRVVASGTCAGGN